MKTLSPLEYLNVQLELHVDGCRECYCVRRIGEHCPEGKEIRQKIDDLIGNYELERQRRVAA